MDQKQFVARIDVAELACRIIEHQTGFLRPEGMSGREAFECLRENSDGKIATDILKGAKAALDYIVECIREAEPTQ